MSMRFVKFLFHHPKVIASIDFAQKKKMFLTGYKQRKYFLWKTGGFNF